MEPLHWMDKISVAFSRIVCRFTSHNYAQVIDEYDGPTREYFCTRCGEEEPLLSYHDVRVYVGSMVFKPSGNYALRLTCCRVAGWELWDTKMKTHEHWALIGGEFDTFPFAIEVGDTMILGKRPDTFAQPPPFGWDGTVDYDGEKVKFGP